MMQGSFTRWLMTVVLAAAASGLAGMGFWFAAKLTTCRTDTCGMDHELTLIGILAVLIFMLIVFAIAACFHNRRIIDWIAWVAAGAIVAFLIVAFVKSGMSVERAVEDFRSILLGPIPVLLGIAVQRRIFRMRIPGPA